MPAAGQVWIDVLPSLKGFREKLVHESKSSGEDAGEQGGERYGGAFGRAVHNRLRAAFRALPQAELKADPSPAEKAIANIRARLKTLSDQRIGVDVSTTVAMAKVERMEMELRRLAELSPSVQVKTDAAAAAAQLVAIKALANSVNGTQVDVDTKPAQRSAESAGSSFGEFNQVMRAIGTGAPALLVGLVGPLLSIVAAAGAAAAALGALAAAFGVGLVGAIGVGVAAFAGVGDAVKAMSDEQDQAGRTAAKNAAQQTSAAHSVENAERAVADARRGVADATRAASQQVKDALEQQREAERTLRDAQRDAQRAQEDLTQARRDARRDLQDLTLSVEENRLAQRRANLTVAQAKRDLAGLGPTQLQLAQATSALATAQERYNAVAADPKKTTAQQQAAKVAMDSARQRLVALQATTNGSKAERAEAQLALDEAKLRARQVSIEGKRLAAEKKEADRTGVAGTERVRAAQDRLRQANQKVADAQRGVTNAERGVQRARVEGARSVAAAQRQVANAQRALAQQIASNSARAAAETDKVGEALGKLTAPARQFAKFLFNQILPRLKQISRIAGKNLFPGLIDGLKAMRPLWPVIGRAVGIFARALGTLARDAGKALGSKFWRDFVELLGRIGGKVILSAGRAFGQLAKAFAILFIAFAPLIADMLPGIVKLATAFADWAADWVKSGGFKEFIAYIRANGPMLLTLVGQIIVFVIELLKAFAPFAPIVLSALIMMFRSLTKLMPVILIVVNLLWGFGSAILYAMAGALDFAANVKARLGAMWRWIKDVFTRFGKWLVRSWNGFWGAVGKYLDVKVKLLLYRIRIFLQNIRLGLDLFKKWGLRKWNQFWDGVANIAKRVGDNTKRGISSFLNGAKKSFTNGVAAMGAQWKRLQNLSKRPVSFMLRTVIQKGIIGGFNKVAGLFGVKPFKFEVPKGFASGTPNLTSAANVGWTNKPTAIVGEGSRRHPEVVIPTDPKYRGRALGLWEQAGFRLMASGGLVAFGKMLRKKGFRVGEHPAFGGVAPVHSNGSWHYRGGAIDVNYGPPGQSAQEQKAFDALIKSGIARKQYGLRSIWRYPGHFDHAHFDIGSGPDMGMKQGGGKGILGMFGDVAAALNPFKGLTDKAKKGLAKFGAFGDLAFGAARKMIQGALKWVTENNPLMGLGEGEGDVGGGVRRWAGLVKRVLTELNLPAYALQPVLNRIKQESGGNPKAINNWDSNAAAGHPSQGLMQTIPGTFNAYAGPYRKLGITNPLANIYAGINYARHRYGKGWIAKMNAPGGYDSSGTLMPGYTLAFNGTRKPENVLRDDHLFNLVRSASVTDGQFTGTLRLSSGEFLGMVDGRIEQVNEKSARAAYAGRKG